MGGLPVKPKLQGYVAQELFDEFERFRATHNLNQSKALEKLLAEYFGKPSASTAPQDEIAAAASLLAAMRAEVAALRLELVQRLEVVESRLAIESAIPLEQSALPLDGLADESAAPMISLSDESVTGFSVLVAESASESVDLQSGSAYESAIPIDESASESAVVEDAITLPATVSATVSADVSAGESAGEPPEEETVVVEEPAAGEPEEEALVVATSEPAVVEAIAAPKSQHLNRQQLGKYFGKSHETIRQWEADGKLAEKGWEVVPGTGSSPKKPRLYRLVSS